MNTVLYLAIMIAAGMAVGRLAKLVKLPNVTGYIIAGLILGPSVLNIVPETVLSNIEVVSDVALGFIAFSIGNEFKLAYFKRVGTAPIVIAVLESFMAVIVVFAGLLIAGEQVPFSLLLGAIAAATAPAATIMVINQYKAKGPVTETLLSVVAIDDATTLIFFGISMAIAQTILSPTGVSFKESVLMPAWEIFGSLIIGGALGLLFTLPLRWFKKDGNRTAITVGFVFAAVGISQLLGLSDLLLCMAMGATLANLSNQTDHIMRLTDNLTPPIYMLFFVASGAALQLGIIPTVGIVGIIYLVTRVIGKIFGTWLGGVICKCERNVKLYLGPALLPQAGVAIGLSLVAAEKLPEYAAQIRAIVLCATLVYELIGPAITKACLKKAGEITTA